MVSLYLHGALCGALSLLCKKGACYVITVSGLGQKFCRLSGSFVLFCYALIMQWYGSWCRLMFLSLIFYKGETVCRHTFWKLFSVEFSSSILWVHRQLEYVDKFLEITVNFKIYSFYFSELKVSCSGICSLCGKQFQSLFLTAASFCFQHFP